MIINQALLSAGDGVLGCDSHLVGGGAKKGNGDAIILLPLEVAVGMFVIAVLMCTGASVISIPKTAIDPPMVFEG